MQGMWAYQWDFQVMYSFVWRDAGRYPEFRLEAVNCDNCRAPYSFHAGVNAVFCDGSVHFLSEKIHADVLAPLLAREDGEIVPAGDWR
jgi:prepilin-type processing-associated H-X9-DG protein